jgi:hypothetical protein
MLALGHVPMIHKEARPVESQTPGHDDIPEEQLDDQELEEEEFEEEEFEEEEGLDDEEATRATVVWEGGARASVSRGASA